MIAHNHPGARDALAAEDFERRYGGDRLPNVEQLFVRHNDLHLPAASVDVVLMSMVYHDTYWHDDDVDWGPIDRGALLAALLAALKPGGVVGVVDHYAAAGADPAESVMAVHRIDRAVVDRDFLAAGFEAGRRERRAALRRRRLHAQRVRCRPSSAARTASFYGSASRAELRVGPDLERSAEPAQRTVVNTTSARVFSLCAVRGPNVTSAQANTEAVAPRLDRRDHRVRRRIAEPAKRRQRIAGGVERLKEHLVVAAAVVGPSEPDSIAIPSEICADRCARRHRDTASTPLYRQQQLRRRRHGQIHLAVAVALVEPSHRRASAPSSPMSGYFERTPSSALTRASVARPSTSVARNSSSTRVPASRVEHHPRRAGVSRSRR